jgi:hypothetical protein
MTPTYVSCSGFLDPLADYGGLTKTHRLAFGSPAIDAGDPLAPGQCRHCRRRHCPAWRDTAQGTACDIGAHRAP